MAGWLGGWLAGWLAGIAIEVEFEVASRWAINAIIAIIINARTKPLSPCVNMTPLKIKKKVIAKSVIYHFLHTFLIVY